MKKYQLILIAGARPNFMKIAPLMCALEGHPTIEPILVHTGQHYDEKMSELFFKQLEIPEPDINLEVGSASHAVQTARIMERFEKVCLDVKPDMVMVVGDVNSTVACTLVSTKLGIKTAHYEAGLRSRDRTMPEEINRIVTDAICDFFFTTNKDADDNLIQEGKSEENIYFVGNLMIDTLMTFVNEIDEDKSIADFPVNGSTFSEMFKKRTFGVITFHRPANVDDPKSLKNLIKALSDISERVPLVFPAHPRTIKNIETFGLRSAVEQSGNFHLIKPVGYLEFIHMVRDAKFVITDSGGIQEETTVLEVPCLTVRKNTERPITVWEGTNRLIEIEDIGDEVSRICNGLGKKGKVPEFWDGQAAHRIVKVLEKLCH